MDTTSIPPNALVRLVALLDDEASVTMPAVQAATLSKLVADQAAATDWTEAADQQQQQEQQNDEGEGGKSAGDGGDEGAASKKPKEPTGPEMVIPVPIGTAENLRAVVRYLSARLASPQREIPAPLAIPVEEAVDDTDKSFLRSLSDPHTDVLSLASIAHYLNIPTLRDLMCAQMASWMGHMCVEEMRTLLGVTNDFSDAEIALLKKEFQLEDIHWKGPQGVAAAAAAAPAAAAQ